MKSSLVIRSPSTIEAIQRSVCSIVSWGRLDQYRIASALLMIRCIAATSSYRARRRINRSVRISSATLNLYGPLKHCLEHRGIEATRILVVAAAVIAIDQPSPTRKLMLCAMGKLGARNGYAKAPAQAVMGDLSKRDKGLKVRQFVDRRHQEGPTIGLLARERLILWREAFDCVENDCTLEKQPIVRIGSILAFGQPELQQRRVE